MIRPRPTVYLRDDLAGPPQPERRWATGADRDFSPVPVSATGPAAPFSPGVVPRVVHQAIHSAGQPLDPATRAFFERRMAANTLVPPLFAPGAPRTIDSLRGQREQEADQLADRLTEPRPADPSAHRRFDLSGVYVHTDSLAAASARRLHAAAYSVGRPRLGAGQRRPDTHAGRRYRATRHSPSPVRRRWLPAKTPAWRWLMMRRLANPSGGILTPVRRPAQGRQPPPRRRPGPTSCSSWAPTSAKRRTRLPGSRALLPGPPSCRDVHHLRP